MEAKAFDSFIDAVKLKQQPPLTGEHLSEEQIDAMKHEINNLHDSDMENYFAVIVEPRLRK